MNQDEILDRFYECQTNLCFIVDVTKVNLDDVIACTRPGAIIRTTDINALKVISKEDSCLGLVGGMISDED